MTGNQGQDAPFADMCPGSCTPCNGGMALISPAPQSGDEDVQQLQRTPPASNESSLSHRASPKATLPSRLRRALHFAAANERELGPGSPRFASECNTVGVEHRRPHMPRRRRKPSRTSPTECVGSHLAGHVGLPFPSLQLSIASVDIWLGLNGVMPVIHCCAVLFLFAIKVTMALFVSLLCIFAFSDSSNSKTKRPE